MECSLCKGTALRIVNGKGYCLAHKKEAYAEQLKFAQTERSKSSVRAYESTQKGLDLRLNGPRGLRGKGSVRW